MTTLSAAQIASAAKAGGFAPAEIPTAVAVALAESGGNPTATHHNSDGSTDYGLWQINSVHAAEFNQGDWRDPATNARMAHDVFNSQGWHAWTTYNSGAYRSHTVAAHNGTVSAQNAGWHLVPVLPNLPPIPLPWGDGTPLPSIPSPGSIAKGVLGLPADFMHGLSIISSAAFWRRAMYWVLGLLVILIGVTLMVESNKSVRGKTIAAAKTAGEAALVA